MSSLFFLLFPLFLFFVVILLRWIFYPYLISKEEERKERKEEEKDSFLINKKLKEKKEIKDENIKEFNQRIFLQSKYDLTLIIPAYNEVQQITHSFLSFLCSFVLK